MFVDASFRCTIGATQPSLLGIATLEKAASARPSSPTGSLFSLSLDDRRKIDELEESGNCQDGSVYLNDARFLSPIRPN